MAKEWCFLMDLETLHIASPLLLRIYHFFYNKFATTLFISAIQLHATIFIVASCIGFKYAAKHFNRCKTRTVNYTLFEQTVEHTKMWSAKKKWWKESLRAGHYGKNVIFLIESTNANDLFRSVRFVLPLFFILCKVIQNAHVTMRNLLGPSLP